MAKRPNGDERRGYVLCSTYEPPPGCCGEFANDVVDIIDISLLDTLNAENTLDALKASMFFFRRMSLPSSKLNWLFILVLMAGAGAVDIIGNEGLLAKPRPPPNCCPFIMGVKTVKSFSTRTSRNRRNDGSINNNNIMFVLSSQRRRTFFEKMTL